MLVVTPDIMIDEGELTFSFVRAGGPGGQHVNKVATAVQLRFDVQQTIALPSAVRERLVRLAGRQLTAEGVLVIQAGRFRSQERNREDALARLVGLIRRAAEVTPVRRPTRPTAAAQERRLRHKRVRSETKQRRRQVPGAEE
jgi:ribosome-associated protein